MRAKVRLGLPLKTLWDIFEKGKTYAEVYKITENGNEYIKNIDIKNNKLHLNIGESKAYLVKLK